ncbi:MAG: hypothetical protein AB7O49_10230 [Sphingomonadales bacterium]
MDFSQLANQQILRRLVVVASVLGLGACATGYQSQGFTGGFTETQLDRNVFRVTFNGNGFTSASRAEEMALLRSAELTIAHGYRFFVLAASRTNTNVSTYTTPTTSTTNVSGTVTGNHFSGSGTTTTYGGQTYYVSKPESNNLVIMYPDRPAIDAMVFDAQFICQSVGTKYKVICGAKS